MSNIWFRTAALFMLAGVALGAFGAHLLQRHLHPAAMQVYHTGIIYHYIHALGLFAVAAAMSQRPGPRARWAGYCFVSGILIFSGSLYLVALTAIRLFGLITPVGGLLFLAGWALLAIGDKPSNKGA